MEKFYYAVIKKEDDAYIVEIPDLERCYTQGYSMEEAIEMAEDVLAIRLEDEKNKNIKASNFKTMESKYGGKGVYIMKISVRPELMFDYSDKVRKNISFSLSTLDKIDSYAKKLGMNRSAFVDYAALKIINGL